MEAASMTNQDNAGLSESHTTRLDRVLAAPMFVATLIFLGGFGVMLHMYQSPFWASHGNKVLMAMLILYPLYPLELVAHWVSGGKGLRQNWLCCALPFARLGARDHVDQTHTWLPGLGWRRVTRSLAQGLMAWFSVPMIVIALLMVPAIILEFFYDSLLQARPNLKSLVDATSSFIWACFVAEFVLVVAAVNNRWRYCRQHWINVAVIVLPAIAFLRVVRIARLLAINQIARTSRVFRLRGLSIRAWRAIVALQLIDRILRRDPQVLLDRTRSLLAEKEAEMGDLRAEIERLERVVAERAQTAEETKGESSPMATRR
jgi:voltage-gated potassium channel